MGTMERLLRLMAEKKATDLFFSVGAPITIKMQGNSVPVNQTILDTPTIEGLLKEVLSEAQWNELVETRELNTRTAVPDVGVYRLSCFFQRGTPAMVTRYIPSDIPKFDSLNLPPVLKDVIMEKRGLIDRKSTRLNSSHIQKSRMPSSA